MLAVEPLAGPRDASRRRHAIAVATIVNLRADFQPPASATFSACGGQSRLFDCPSLFELGQLGASCVELALRGVELRLGGVDPGLGCGLLASALAGG